jgi:RHH-type proline utilization regulon transcriptional repressor/proline dehydrogenase/delta 1-pyrroline-5-carboxylate dehydrogenase
VSEARARGEILEAIDAALTGPPVEIPLVVDGERTFRHDERGDDPSAPATTRCWYAVADEAAVRRAWAAAHRAGAGWEALGPAGRGRLLERAAEVMTAERATTIAVMALDAGKTVAESDPEVSEAVDFARYYARAAHDTAGWGTSRPRGVVVVASPWNFPYAIPAGGVMAALAAGNTVILKPAPESVWTASVLADQCWRAGVPTDVLQLVTCRDDDVGTLLVTGEGTDTVILTGAHETAKRFRGWRPDLHLLAETSGKNAMVITETADLDQAIKDLVRSAFGHAGQKCSAASLAIVEDGIYDDPAFSRRLVDAAASLPVGPASEPATVVGPLIRPPTGPLLHALTELDAGERWLLEPVAHPDNPNLWSPGIKAGVRPGSPFHLTECFGPVLGLMRAADLAHAIELQNAPPYGLTGGLQSLSADEVATWLEQVQVGNAYVNRTTTGAIVRRQPFGGWKRSVVGPTAKAGGPSYLAALRRWPEPDADADGADDDWSEAWAQLQAEPADPTDLAAEANVLRHVARDPMWLRVGSGAAPASVAAALAAGAAVGVEVTVSQGEAEAAFAQRLRADPRPVRALGTVGSVLRATAQEVGVDLDDTPVAASRRVELLRWVREQAVSVTMHRHGIPGDALLSGWCGPDGPARRS